MIAHDILIPSPAGDVPAHIARPEESSGEHPAVIVLPEVFGMTPETKRVAQLLPTLGYVGIAVDYYHRIHPGLCYPYTPEGSKRAFEAANMVTEQELVSDVRAAVDWLNAQSFVEHGRIATWGFGFGGTAAIATASLTELSGAIAFYPDGVLEPMPDGKPFVNDVSNVAVPLLLLFGELDYYVARYDMDRIYRTLTALQKDVRMNIYPGVGHSFFRHGRPQAVAELRKYSDEAIAHAVADSWNLVKTFLGDVFSEARPRLATIARGL